MRNRVGFRASVKRERKEGAVVVSVLWSLAAVPILVVYSGSIRFFSGVKGAIDRNGLKMAVHF